MKKTKSIPSSILWKIACFLVEIYVTATKKGKGLQEYLKSKGVIIVGDHLVYTKGGHGDVYVNIKGLNAFQLIPVSIQMAYEIHISGFKPAAFAGVPYGADILASQVALFYSLFSGEEVLNLKLMKEGGDGFSWYKDNGDYVEGVRIVFIEDVINTGGSLVRCGKFIRDSRPAAISCWVVCDRLSDKNPGLSVLGKEFQVDDAGALLSIEAANYDVPEGTDPREHCPLCAEGRKINTSTGHGKAFLLKMKNTFPDFHAWITGEKRNY